MLRIIIIIIIVIISFFLQSVSRLLLYSVSFFFSPLYLLTRHLPNLFHFLHISFVSSIHPPSHLSSSVAWRPLLLYQWAAAGSMSLSLCPFLSSLFLFFSPQTLLVSYFFPTFYVVEGFLLLGFFFCLFLACAQGYLILIQMHIFFFFQFILSVSFTCSCFYYTYCFGKPCLLFWLLHLHFLLYHFLTLSFPHLSRAPNYFAVLSSSQYKLQNWNLASNDLNQSYFT